MTTKYIKIAVLGSIFTAMTACAAAPLTLELEITNSGKSADNVIAAFIFPACSAAPVNLAQGSTWDGAKHVLSVPIGSFTQGQKRTITVQVPAESQKCLETNQISGSWFSAKPTAGGANPAPAPAQAPLSFLKVGDIDFDLIVRALIGFGVVLLASGGLYGLLLYRRRAMLYALIVDANTKNPITRAVVTVLKADDNQAVGGRTGDAEGRIALRMSPGRYYMTCTKDGYQQLKTEVIELEKGKENSQILEMRRG